MDQIVPFVWISLSIGSFVSKIQRRATDIAEIVTPSQRIILQWEIHQAVIKFQSLNTKMTPHLLPELLMVLRANDAEGLKGWLTVGFE